VSTASTAYCIIRRSTVFRSQAVSHLSAEHVVLNSLHFHNYKLPNKLSLSFHLTSLSNYHFQMAHLLVLLQSCSMIIFKCISKLTQSQPLSSHSHGLQVHMYKLDVSRPPSASPNSFDSGLHVRKIMASKCSSKLAQLCHPSLNNHCLQLHISKLARSQSPGVLPHLLDYSLHGRTLMVSMCMTLYSQDYSHLVRMITSSRFA